MTSGRRETGVGLLERTNACDSPSDVSTAMPHPESLVIEIKCHTFCIKKSSHGRVVHAVQR